MHNFSWNKEQLAKANVKLIEENKILKNAVKKFVNKNFHGGSKANREDYVVMVSSKDIWELRELLLKR